MHDACLGKDGFSWCFFVGVAHGRKSAIIWGKKLRFAMRICSIAWHGIALHCAGIRLCCIDWHQRYLKGLELGEKPLRKIHWGWEQHPGLL